MNIIKETHKNLQFKRITYYLSCGGEERESKRTLNIINIFYGRAVYEAKEKLNDVKTTPTQSNNVNDEIPYTLLPKYHTKNKFSLSILIV